MSDEFKAGVRLRRVGRELRKWRERTGLKNADAANRLKWSTSKVSKIENAAQPIQGVDVIAMALVYDVPEQERNQLFQAVLTAQDPGWWQDYDKDILFEAAQDFMELESEAVTERTFMSDLVPGVLQTEDYAVALARAAEPQVPEDVARRRAEVRSVRQTRLAIETPLNVEAVVWEPALRQRVGGAQVMRAQINRLVDWAERPNIRFQVLPMGTGAYPAMGCSFTMLSFVEDHFGDVVYLDNLTHSGYLEASQDVAAYTMNFAALQEAALGSTESVALMTEIAASLDN